jgi:hypothetical protein
VIGKFREPTIENLRLASRTRTGVQRETELTETGTESGLQLGARTKVETEKETEKETEIGSGTGGAGIEGGARDRRRGQGVSVCLECCSLVKIINFNIEVERANLML